MKATAKYIKKTNLLFLKEGSIMKKILIFVGILVTLLLTMSMSVSAAPNFSNTVFRAEGRVNIRSSLNGNHDGWFDYTSGDIHIVSFGHFRSGVEYFRVRYPLFAGGHREGFARRSDILMENRQPIAVNFRQNSTVFRQSNLRTNFGTAWGGDRGAGYAWAVGSRGNSVQVLYRLDAGGHRLGWVPGGTVDSRGDNGGGTTTPPPPTNSTAVSGGWQWPMNNFQVTADWQHRANNPPAAGRTHHTGIDIVSSDTRVFAVARGVVVQAGWNDANGNFVTIRHTLENGQRVYSFYAHLRDNTRHLLNQNVSRGQQIGVMGNTGRSSGAHLHFSISNSPGSNGDLVGWAAPGASNRASHGNITFFNPRSVIQNNRLP